VVATVLRAMVGLALTLPGALLPGAAGRELTRRERDLALHLQHMTPAVGCTHCR